MLKLKPSCENCDKSLPPDSAEARICSYECTFCENCVSTILHNVCPNCGGGFVPRPIRPKTAYLPNTSLEFQPASKEKIVKPVDAEQHAALLQKVAGASPEKR